MPRLRPPRPHRPARPRRPGRRAGGTARIVVLGDLMLDVVLAPERALETGTDVPGRVTLTQGGSAANTARWLGRLGARTTLIAAVGRDAAGRALVDAVRADGVMPRVRRVPGVQDGTDRRAGGARWRAVLRRGPRRRRPAPPGGPRPWLVPRGRRAAPPGLFAAGRAARAGGTPGRGARPCRVARSSASISPRSPRCSPRGGVRPGRSSPRSRRTCCSRPPRRPRRCSAATPSRGCSSSRRWRSSSAGRRGPPSSPPKATATLRFEVATQHVQALDTTGAGDAFDAGFLVGWFAARAAGRSVPASLQRAALAGHRAATRQLTSPRAELSLS